MGYPGIFPQESPGTGMALPKHTCHAPGCDTEVHPRLLMCWKHWRDVPYRLKKRVWDHYRSGQEVSKQPTAEYVAAAQAAIASIGRQMVAKRVRREDDE